MDAIITIAERKARATARRRASIERVVAELRDYAARQSGRFLIFGSAAKGLVGEHSDLDVIVDFPPSEQRKALDFLEDACLRHGVPCDPQGMPRDDSEFHQRVCDHAVILP